MKRFALIIEASNVPGQNRLTGAPVDVQCYEEWLRAGPGGGWYDEEIKKLSNPTPEQVTATLSKLGEVDYAFITFSGHGYHAKERDQTQLCLYNGNISVQDLRPRAQRCTMIIDACRKVETEKPLIEGFAKARRSVVMKSAAVMRNYRLEFERSLSNTETGTIVIYSCSLDQSAADSRSFSQSLVSFGWRFADENVDKNRVFSIRDAFEKARDATNNLNFPQLAEIVDERRRTYFPFAI